MAQAELGNIQQRVGKVRKRLKGSGKWLSAAYEKANRLNTNTKQSYRHSEEYHKQIPENKQCKNK